MLLQITLGSGLLVLNVLVMAVAALVLETGFRVAHPWLITSPQRPKLLLLIVTGGIWVLLVLTVNIWIWAFMLF
jgi:hypothetical protein